MKRQREEYIDIEAVEDRADAGGRAASVESDEDAELLLGSEEASSEGSESSGGVLCRDELERKIDFVLQALDALQAEVKRLREGQVAQSELLKKIAQK